MSAQTTIGFPRMKHEAGEKRVFPPSFIQFLLQYNVCVSLEEGYGSRLGYTFDDYRHTSPDVNTCSREECFQKDYVIILRSPPQSELRLLSKDSCMISMLHFPTRSKRLQLLKDLGVKAISLDCIVNDRNLRLVEDMKAVAWNGLEVAFDVLEGHLPGLERSDGEPIRSLVIGTGMVGKHAVDAATKLGNVERNNDHIRAGGSGSMALAVGRNLSSNFKAIVKLFRDSDILVDAAQRRDPSKPLVPNEWIAYLPDHAVIADLSVDPYLLDAEQPVVRGIEGIPQGNLDQYIFTPDDPHWGKTIPESIPTKHRRTTVSCYSWPGIHPEASMLHYASQMEPLMQTLLTTGYESLSPNGDYFERALFRATLKDW